MSICKQIEGIAFWRFHEFSPFLALFALVGDGAL
jgi:hypothetical protein